MSSADKLRKDAEEPSVEPKVLLRMLLISWSNNSIKTFSHFNVNKAK